MPDFLSLTGQQINPLPEGGEVGLKSLTDYEVGRPGDGPVCVPSPGQPPCGSFTKSDAPREKVSTMVASPGDGIQEGYGINVAPVSFIDQPARLQ